MAQEKLSGKNLEAELVPLTLRLPKPLHAKLKSISEAEFRSLNHQVIMALSYFVEMQEKFGTVPSPELLKKAVPAGALGPWLKPGTGAGSRGAR